MDGSTLAGVETATLTQGVAFLYSQAGELLRRRRDARDRAAAKPEMPGGEASVPAPESFPSLQLPADVFESPGTAPVLPVPAALDRVADGLLQARRDIDDYVLGMAVLDPESAAVLQAIDRLRRLLEEVYGASVTFRGERQRPAVAATRINARQIGVALSGSVNVTGDIAGRDINKNT
jgi:hypothetical protein